MKTLSSLEVVTESKRKFWNFIGEINWLPIIEKNSHEKQTSDCLLRLL